jgi:hypothetical protein
MFRAIGPISPVHPLYSKFSSAHIDKFLDYSHKDDENTYKLQSSNRMLSLPFVEVGRTPVALS